MGELGELEGLRRPSPSLERPMPRLLSSGMIASRSSPFPFNDLEMNINETSLAPIAHSLCPFHTPDGSPIQHSFPGYSSKTCLGARFKLFQSPETETIAPFHIPAAVMAPMDWMITFAKQGNRIDPGFVPFWICAILDFGLRILD